MTEKTINKDGEVRAEVKELVELLQYQDGSIVSRVLLKNKGGTVTLFAFDVGEGLSEHTAPFDALVVVIEGEADVEIAAESFKLQQGETIILPGESAACDQSIYEVQNVVSNDPSILLNIVKRQIIGFDTDEHGHFRAELDCGHFQHVRHDPPLTTRPWVLTEEGRASRIGFELDCKRCDEEAGSNIEDHRL